MARNFGTPAKDDYGRLELESSTSSCVMEAPTLNETLCRALIHARLTEEDVAARLRVDPKTVRRWLEGRVPYLRYRWAIATMLGIGETDLWPQLRTARTRPDDVIAIYPHRDTVPLDMWLRLFRSARHEIGILDDTGSLLAADQPIVAALAEQARAGIKIRICLHAADQPWQDDGPQGGRDAAASVREAVAVYAPLQEKGEVDIRLYEGVVYNSIYYSDDELLVSHQVDGVPIKSAPTLRLQLVEGSDIAATFLGAFEAVWSAAAHIGSAQ
jgi:transcriptional regulator with XRE-family HTH domain